MYFVTTKRPGYALFCMTPSERAAIAVTDDQRRVHVLERRADGWHVARDWAVEERAHTDVMTRLADVAEPGTTAETVALLAGGAR